MSTYLTGLNDTREDKRTNNLLNTQRTKTRSGHVLELNDNEGVEHITLQHRTGAMLQFQPDGSVRFVSQNGKMGLEINGEGYVNVTGAYYIKAKTGSITTEGDLDITVHGNMSTTVDGTYTVIANDIVMTAGESATVSANNFKLATVTSSKFTCEDYTSISSNYKILLRSMKDDIWITAKYGIWESAGDFITQDATGDSGSGTIKRNAKASIKDTATRIDHN